MAMNLTFFDTTWYVEVELEDIADGTVKVERSYLTQDGPWMPVRGGVTVPVNGGDVSLNDWEYADGVPNWYRVTRLDPDPGLILDGEDGAFAAAPDRAELDITGDIDVRVELVKDFWDQIGTPTQVAIVKGVRATNQFSWELDIRSSGILAFQWSEGGGTPRVIASTAAVPSTFNGERVAIRATLDVDNGSGGWTVRFYTGSTVDGVWTPLGDPTSAVTGGPTSIFPSMSDLVVGSDGDSHTSTFDGTILAAKVLDGINGTVVADPDFEAQTEDSLTFDDDAGNDWTVMGGAQLVGTLVSSPQMIVPDNGGRTILKSVMYPALNRAIPEPDYRPIQRANRVGIYNVRSKSTPIASFDTWTSPYWTIETVTEDLVELRDLDLCVTASNVMFLQVPPEDENECLTNPVSGMPGGYVAIINATETHVVPGSHAFRWVLPLRIVEPPSPHITPTTITWETVKRLYGSWEALWVSNPTWRDLWEQAADPEDFFTA